MMGFDAGLGLHIHERNHFLLNYQTMNRREFFSGLATSLALLALWGCESSTVGGGKRGDTWRVVCTTGMVADVAREVGGSRVAVTSLMGEGVDPHLYKASPGDVKQLEDADLICYSGLHLEGKLAETLEQLAHRKKACALAEHLPKDRILYSDGGESDGGFPDPHVWFDVALWAQTIDAVRESLAKLDPEHASEFEVNAKRYHAELLKLHAECREQLASIPKSRRVLVTAHDAFRYFGRAYDIDVKAIQGISTEGEAGVKQINELVHFISENRIKAVFTESSVNERNMQSLVEGCKQGGHEVGRGGELFSDAMGKADTPEGTYIGMVRHNITMIVQGLK
ncbi:MAG: periplasmic solute binding protein [Planctomycetaceae bacterium]|nr:periplasmic solute binding protein [Planctomycetaceae bacterium]